MAAAALSQPIVIAHRGASGERPEHTLAAYELAIEQGADFIEPDLVMTKDGVLVARHENEISGTTDVAAHSEFANRKATKTIDGQTVTGWFTEDLTLAELKTLRTRERLPQVRPGNTKYDGQFAVPTFDEVIALAKAKRVVVYPETKHPSYFRAIGLPLEDKLLAALERAGWTRASDPVFVQSFEAGNILALRGKTRLRLVQLIDARGGPADRPDATYAAMLTDTGLADVAKRADAIGINKSLLTADLVARAHAAGLKVHAWTYRAEPMFLAPGQPDLAAELRAAYATGVDGVFSDFPGQASAARPGWQRP